MAVVVVVARRQWLLLLHSTLNELYGREDHDGGTVVVAAG